MTGNLSTKNTIGWFKNETFFWRCVYGVVSVGAIYFFSYVLVLLFLNASSIYIHLWIGDILRATFSLSAFAHYFIAVCLSATLILIHSQFFRVTPLVFSNRVGVVWRILKPKHLSVILSFCISAAILIRFLLSLASKSYGSLIKICDVGGNDESSEKKFCLNEEHEFVVLFGGYIGLTFGICYFVYDYSYVSFPIIQQPKFLQIKQSLRPRIVESAIITIRHLKWFCLLYCLLGPFLIPAVMNLMHLDSNSDEFTVWALFWKLWNLKLLWTAFVMSTAVMFTFNQSVYIFKTFQTEIVHFQLETPFNADGYKTLGQTLLCEEFPLLQYLGYQDLSIVSRMSKLKRKDIYSLSQPGGHPHHWNHVKSLSLNLIGSLENRLSGLGGNKRLVQNGTGSNKMENLADASTSILNRRPIRDLAHHPYMSIEKDNVPITTKEPPPIAKIVSYLDRKKHEIWSYVLGYPIIGFLFKEFPDTKSRKEFAECQPHVWAIEAISNLTAFSYYEDSFGVIQKSLSEILSSLLNLQQSLDHHQKLDISGFRRLKDSSAIPPDFRLKNSLKSSVSSAIYKITTTFGECLSDLDLSANHKWRLKKYLEDKE